MIPDLLITVKDYHGYCAVFRRSTSALQYYKKFYNGLVSSSTYNGPKYAIGTASSLLLFTPSSWTSVTSKKSNVSFCHPLADFFYLLPPLCVLCFDCTLYSTSISVSASYSGYLVGKLNCFVEIPREPYTTLFSHILLGAPLFLFCQHFHARSIRGKRMLEKRISSFILHNFISSPYFLL